MESSIQSQPPWNAAAERRMRAPLTRDESADVCVIGAGMAGLATAFELARNGRRVVVLDDGPIGGGETGRTSAHLSCVIDDRFCRIEQLHGPEASRLCYESHLAAIEWIAAVADREAIDCDFRRLDGYLFLPPGEDDAILFREAAAAQRAGFADVERIPRGPLPSFETGPCLRFPRQAQFNPLAFLVGLADALERLGGRIFCGSHVSAIDEQDGLLVRTDKGPTVRAHSVVVATNTPINDIVTLHTKQHAYRTYAVALPIEPDLMEPALYWDTSQTAGDLGGPYHYVRLAMMNAERPLLIVGGEDHKTGQANDGTVRWTRLAMWASARFPVISEPEFRWSGQVMEPVDHVAFIGPNPTGPDHVYIMTGDSGMGITHAAIGAMLIGDLIAGRQNPWAALYDPARRTLRSAVSFARENLNTAAQYADWLRGGDVESTAEIRIGCGAIVRHGFKLLACYRDDSGYLHIRSAACPHLGGVVHWNSAERTWDCPCHGSRFDADGTVLNGPAVSPLPEAGPTTGNGASSDPVTSMADSASTDGEHGYGDR